MDTILVEVASTILLLQEVVDIRHIALLGQADTTPAEVASTMLLLPVVADIPLTPLQGLVIIARLGAVDMMLLQLEVVVTTQQVHHASVITVRQEVAALQLGVW